MYKALNKALSETGLPAYLCEGILQELLAEVRKQKCYEMLNEINNAQNAQKEGQTDENNN